MSTTSVEVPDDSELVAAAIQGDRLAFTQLLERHGREVYGLVLRLTRDHELASDVAQETWIRAWKGLSTFRGDAAFTTWLYRIAVNTAATARRRQARHRQTALTDIVEPEDRTHPQPEGRADQLELRRRLSQALGHLPPGLRTVVIMKDVYGWSHLEISTALDISVTAAKVRLHRAHQRLQKYLHEETG